MSTLSRHLPPAPTHPQISRLQVIVTLCICAILFAASLCFDPIKYEMLGFVASLAVFAGIVFILSKFSDHKFEKMMVVRAGESICSFRRAFNLRQVDPWIVRAVHEEVRDLVGSHPIRASDRLTKDLRIDAEDVEDIAKIVAARAGYDFADTQTNPLFGKVSTVGELVMFFTRQRRQRS